MASFATTILTVSVGTWIGAIVFQSAVVAPAVFAGLDESAARLFLRTLFPRFYRFGLICGAFMLAGLAGYGAEAGWSSSVVVPSIVTIAMIALTVLSLAMVPHINAARDAGESGQAAFSRLHRVSVLLTVGILLLGIGILTSIAVSAATGV